MKSFLTHHKYRLMFFTFIIVFMIQAFLYVKLDKFISIFLPILIQLILNIILFDTYDLITKKNSLIAFFDKTMSILFKSITYIITITICIMLVGFDMEIIFGLGFCLIYEHCKECDKYLQYIEFKNKINRKNFSTCKKINYPFFTNH